MSAAPASLAAVYQRLRSHLAYLRLADAAEALPRVIDAARADQLDPTATLERLLAVEVDAAEARRHANRLRFACLPAPYTLTGFDFSAQPGVDEALIRDDTRGVKYSTLGVVLVACAAGGEAGEPGQPGAGVGGRGAAASAAGRGDARRCSRTAGSSWPRTRCRSSTRCCARTCWTGCR